MKVCLVGSSGGHLTHLYMLKPFWKDKERFWVTFDKEDAKSMLKQVYKKMGLNTERGITTKELEQYAVSRLIALYREK